ncbi:MAG: SDR family NAD(P)-dependent oxidoreductase [Methylococcales bacterium]
MVGNKIALITGGSSGLGLSMAKKLAGEGYIPVLVARNSTRLANAVQLIKDAGYTARAFTADVSKVNEIEQVVREVEKEFGEIHFLVLNAGVVHTKLLLDYDNMETLKEVLEIDLWGTVLCARCFVPLMKDGSKILLVSSAFALIGGAGYSTYCAAKAGVMNFGESLRRELLSESIAVYVACPADIDTPQYEQEIADSPAWMKSSHRNRPLSADVAAKRILKKCKGSRFLIIINSDVLLLQFIARIFPRRLKDLIIDHSLPSPQK